jgi:hypothetical protein
VVNTLATAQDNLDVAQSVISEVQGEANDPYADRLFNAVRALQGVIDDLEEGEDTAEGLLDAVR